LQEQKQYQSAALEGKGPRLVAEKEFKEEFAKKIPALRERVEGGDYDSLSTFGGLNGRCPACKKQQSWEKVDGVGLMAFGIVISAIIAVVGLAMWNSGASSGNGHRQLAGLITGGFGAFGFLFAVCATIWGLNKRAAIRRDMANVAVKGKPEFNWPEI
jgi:hypothetical protein